MATYQKGVLGHFNGKVGTVIGSKWKGIAYMRSLPSKSSKAPSEDQLDTRARFALVTSFFKPISKLIKTGYQSVVGNLTPVNAAISYHIKNALIGVSPNFEIDYTKLMFSRGKLTGPKSASAVAAVDLDIVFSWADNANEGDAKANDTVSLLVYCPEAKQYVVLENAAERSDQTVTLRVPETFENLTTHCWIANVNAKGKEVSTSIYLGTVVPIIS